jgi:hypothetical protein
MNRHSIIDFSSLDYLQYCLDNRINELPLIEIDINSSDDLGKKRVEKWSTIDPNNKIPLPPELDDLIRGFRRIANDYVGENCIEGHIEMVNRDSLDDYYLDNKEDY